MIRVTVELLSAIDPSRSTVLAMMDIANDGSESLKNPNFGSYVGATYKGRDRATLQRLTVSKNGAVAHWPRQQFHVWNLVARMLESMGYDKGRPTADRPTDEDAARAARAHYDHHYGPGEFDRLAQRTKKRLIYRARAALVAATAAAEAGQ